MRNEYAEIVNGIVTQVLVVDDTEAEATKWLRDNVSVNQWANAKAINEFGTSNAVIGFERNADLGHFICPKQFDSWSFNASKLCYDAPVIKPAEKMDSTYSWDEKNQKWNELIING